MACVGTLPSSLSLSHSSRSLSSLSVTSSSPSTCTSSLSSLSPELSLFAVSLSSLSPASSPSSPLHVSCRGGGRGGGSSYRPPPSSRPKPRIAARPDMEKGNDGPLMNEQIKVPFVRLLSEDQKMLGEYARLDALGMAREAGLDLVMIAPDAEPPVVRLVDYSKYRFEQQKRKRLAQKKAAANRMETKELKMRYSIDTHDYGVKLRAAQNFLNDGDRVKVTVQFRGREMEFKDMVVKLFDRFKTDIGEVGLVEGTPQLEGRQMQMIVSPNKAVLQKIQAARQKTLASKAGRKNSLLLDEEVGYDSDMETELEIDTELEIGVEDDGKETEMETETETGTGTETVTENDSESTQSLTPKSDSRQVAVVDSST